MSVHSSGLLGFLTSLMEKNYEAVGFIPRPKLEEYAVRGQVLVEKENDDPCGYLVFGNGWPRLRIYQAVIQYDARRREHGLALVARVIREAYARGCDSISLWCADDLDANDFWKAAGFAFGGQRDGGVKRGRKHNLWVMRLRTAQMELSMPNAEALEVLPMADFNSNRFQSKRQTYETPQDLFAPLANEFRFTLDVAADATNAKCAEFFDEAANGLAQDWRGVCWCNPPYREQSKWVKKAFAEARAGRATTVLLVPARTNTGWWHDYCMKGEVRFIRGRPRFAGCKHGLPQPLALVIFRPPDCWQF